MAMKYVFEELIRLHLRVDEDEEVSSYYTAIKELFQEETSELYDAVHLKKGKWHMKLGTSKETAEGLWEFD